MCVHADSCMACWYSWSFGRGVGPSGQTPSEGGMLTSETDGWGAAGVPGAADEPEKMSKEHERDGRFKSKRKLPFTFWPKGTLVQEVEKKVMSDQSDLCRLSADWRFLRPGPIPALLALPSPSENWEALEPEEVMRQTTAEENHLKKTNRNFLREKGKKCLTIKLNLITCFIISF